MIFAFVPPYGAMQVASLILATLAIGRIRRARGALRGRGQAIAGLCISGGLLLLACLGTGVAGYVEAERGNTDDRSARQRLRELAVVQRMYADLDWDGDGRAEPCLTSLTELLDTAQGRGGLPLDAQDLRALRAADDGVRGDAAVPYGGYLFRLERRDDVLYPRPRFEIVARPRRSRGGEVLRVNENGEPYASEYARR
jgi:hypothetical protein